MTVAGAPYGRVFVDSSAWFALADPRDASHADARRVQATLIAGGSALFATNFVVAEAHALFLRRLGRAAALRFLDALGGSAVTVVRVTPADEARAHAILRQYGDKEFSLTDATSFSVMERLRIPTAFTFDKNFGQYGFQILA
jgi:predicted nucleic acid-binding protein